jgi:hypothetical protein
MEREREREREREMEKDKSTFLQPSKDGSMEFVDYQDREKEKEKEKEDGKEDSVIQEILEELSFVTQGPQNDTIDFREKNKGGEEDEKDEDENEDEDNRESLYPFFASSYFSSIFSSNHLKMSLFCAFACLCALYIKLPSLIQPLLNRIPIQMIQSCIAFIIFFLVSIFI